MANATWGCVTCSLLRTTVEQTPSLLPSLCMARRNASARGILQTGPTRASAGSNSSYSRWRLHSRYQVSFFPWHRRSGNSS